PVWLKPSYFSVNHGVVALILENGTCLDGGNVIIPKSIFDQIGYFSQDFGHVGEEIDYGDDTDFLMRAGEIGAIQSYDPDLYILHHIPARKQSIQWFAQQKRKSSYQKAVLYITHHKELRTHPDQLRLKLHFLRRSVVELMEWGVCCIGIVFRDRKEFPFYQNYTIEKILQVYGKMLMTWHIFRLLL
ncbi:MAG TPA: hypothetical protein VN376_05930, partial [Longilinea sp.]|nr:hypothetical protein [Longilinea sp.]